MNDDLAFLKNTLPQFVLDLGPDYTYRNWQRTLTVSGVVPYTEYTRSEAEHFAKSRYKLKHCQLLTKLRKHKTTLYHTTNKLCAKCQQPHELENMELDHIRAIINGGELLDEDNLQLLCKPCHKEKTKQDLAIRLENKSKNIPLGDPLHL